jgi:two-component system nitrate/nitrite response regulator NarL
VGDSVMSPEMTGKLLRELRTGSGAPAGPVLSPREREIVLCLARGASNKEIARDLDVAESTVKIHVQHILRKLNLSSRVQVAVWAIESGIVAKP